MSRVPRRLAPPDPVETLLRACARIELDQDARARVTEAAARVSDWRTLPSRSEYHGVTPLVWQHLRDTGVFVPSGCWTQIGGLVARHRGHGRVQAQALAEIVDALTAARIDCLLLKGAALAHVLYPRPDLRAMTDLDILVDREQAAAAQAILGRLGFDAPAATVRGPQHFHHHLPGATRKRQGFIVSVEIHRDALSRDQPVRLRMDDLSEPPQTFTVDGRSFRAFGHVDMLVHLCAHALQPGDHTRLIGICDLVGYATRYAADIDWDALRRRHRRVVNALALMHYVTPLPRALRAFRPKETTAPPDGAGRSITPLSAAGSRRAGGAFRSLLYPPAWWMHAYYGVPPERSLAPVRWGHHVWRVAYWTGRRAMGSAISRAGPG